ncbi:hypothetical protein Daura_48710 [Dactylosporangium aurantiacum]|uniref:Uncharacterized protein n=1 Tax=Dactylosporangium aurantiacum TaxID=35754 RepID=A0A9Q9IHI1_9ACTN|nr:hypothetical protein [Dactylosporangium aurantiacum]MDG6109645.1 hypothetical protein [Dactylosporangium aurantiacum]UWZ54260.1 hypothetical protein Daura_48710 [Dactylosporangium aurantiacum]
MIVQDDLRGDALRLEIAIALLPLVGRVVQLQDDQPVRHRGNRLTDQDDRRLVIDDAARRWELLDSGQQRWYGDNLRTALYEYTCEYVETVEAGAPGIDEMDSRGYESAMEALWRRHVAALRSAATH